MFVYKNSIKTYCFYSVLFKKQNSFLKKKNNLLNNFYSTSQRSKYSDSFNSLDSYYLGCDSLYYKLYFNDLNKFDLSKVLDLRKKVKKTVLENRKIFTNFLLKNDRSFKVSRLASYLGKKKNMKYVL